MRRLYVLSMMLGLTAVLMMVQGCGVERIPGGTADADSKWADDRAAEYAIDESTSTHWAAEDSTDTAKDGFLSNGQRNTLSWRSGCWLTGTLSQRHLRTGERISKFNPGARLTAGLILREHQTHML